MLGIGQVDERNETADFVVYDLEWMTIKKTLSHLKGDDWPINGSNARARGLSDKGELFFGRFPERAKGGHEGYKIEGYDPETGKLKTEIDISDFLDGVSFNLYYDIADVIRVSSDTILIACCVDCGSIPSNTLNILKYNSATDEMWSIAEFDADEMFRDYGVQSFFDVSFDRDGRKLSCKVDTEEVDDEDDRHICVEFDIAEDFESLGSPVVTSDEESQASDGGMKQLEVESQEAGLFKKGYVRIRDIMNKKVLIDEPMNRSEVEFISDNGEDLAVLEIMRVENGESGSRCFILANNGYNWELVDRFSCDGLCSVDYNYERHSAIIECGWETVIVY